ncbi:hypothetical protein HHL22_11895 [Hymenobacter sp. RP-2-7]|uniref:Uncharacterized protein n=1 Tax=Hymenobacter polaris TaxID=2682546 RepID=A0A7Y0FMI2_9BACT|nr:hypothetical protein [Hymenobacter polaris]NML65908.1 hypothetical protein [Hymenobacter polaris]
MLFVKREKAEKLLVELLNQVREGKTSPDLFGNSLLGTALDRTFNLLDADGDETVMEQVPAVGQQGIMAMQHFLRGIHHCRLEVKMRWDTPTKQYRTWAGTTNRLVSLSSQLGHMREEAPESFSFAGLVLSLKGFIEVQDERQGRIVARYPEEALLAAIQSLHVGQECQGSMVKLTTVHTTTGARKSSFILMAITGR